MMWNERRVSGVMRHTRLVRTTLRVVGAILAEPSRF